MAHNSLCDYAQFSDYTFDYCSDDEENSLIIRKETLEDRDESSKNKHVLGKEREGKIAKAAKIGNV